METGMKRIAVLAALFMIAALSASAFAAQMAAEGQGLAKGRLGAASAGTAEAVEKGYYLETRAAHLACRIDFTTTVLDEVVSAVPETADALSQHSAGLKGDKAELLSLASAGDPGAFNSFVIGTVKPDITDAIKALAQERRNYRSYNLSNDTIAALRSDYDAAREKMKECEKGSIVKLGQARIRHYNAIIGVWQATTDKLGEKGVDTAAMQGVIDGATPAVITPLQAAVDSGDSEQVKAALKTYCLGNGCDGDSGAPQNYHGLAKINLERLSAVVDKLQETADSALLEDAEAKLGIARSTLAEVGTAKYTDEQQETIWDNLREAAKLVRDYMRGIKPAATAAGEAPPAAPAEASQ